MKQNIHIEIVCSTVPGLSSMSLESRNAIQGVLSRHYSSVGITIINNFKDLRSMVASRPDLVFLGMKFIPVDPELGREDTNKIWISDYLDKHGIAYTGSDQFAHEIELDKPLAKKCAQDAGLATSKYYVAEQHDELLETDIRLTYPLFVKPTNRGGGSGIDSDSVVNTFEQLQSKVQFIRSNLSSDSLIEEFLPGREFSVAILKDDDSDTYSLMPLELVAPLDINGRRLLSAEIKLADSESFLAVNDIDIRAMISDLAINAFHALGARDYGRIDIRLDTSGVPHFLEANLIPSLIKNYGNFPKACILNNGIGYEEMIMRIVNLGLNRNKKSLEDTSKSISRFPVLVPSILPV